MQTCRMEFNGRLLKRGFWLYIWDVKDEGRRHLYVGRTGDSSSPNASSPFRRIGQHLDSKDNAKANALYKRLRENHIDPERCTFEMLAIGPLFDEQLSMSEHRPLRDETAALEKALADELRRRGYDVMGHHPSSGQPDEALRDQLFLLLDKEFPDRTHRLRFNPIRLPEGSMGMSDFILHEREDRF